MKERKGKRVRPGGFGRREREERDMGEEEWIPSREEPISVPVTIGEEGMGGKTILTREITSKKKKEERKTGK